MSKIELYHENCLEWLKSQPLNSVAGVVTDPPYYQQGDEDLSIFLNAVLVECIRVSRGPVYFISPLQWAYEKPEDRRGWPQYNPLPDTASGWQTFVWNTAKAEQEWGAAPILGWNGKSAGTFEIELQGSAISGERSTEKPQGVFMRLIRNCKRGTILDPFMGWGTCAKAAKYLGHDFIGIENNREVFEAVRKELMPNSKEDKTKRDGSAGGYAITK